MGPKTSKDEAKKSPSQRTFPEKLVAIGFIVLILTGNFWFAIQISHGKVPDWFFVLVFIGLGCITLGGIPFLIRNIYLSFKNATKDEDVPSKTNPGDE